MATMSAFTLLVIGAGFVGHGRRMQPAVHSGRWNATALSSDRVIDASLNLNPDDRIIRLAQMMLSFDPKLVKNLSRNRAALSSRSHNFYVSPSRRAVLSTILGVPFAARATVTKIAQTAPFMVYSVESAPLDPRSYRGLVLGNGLRVLLASDPKAVTGAASMTIQVGYMSDPSRFPGLAHFCEHMLFLGTKTFPNEGDFQRFVASGGGSNNAFTASEETNYFFDVSGEALPQALDRFAGFFTGPLFTASATSREVNAIDSEHSKNLQSDFWRYSQLIKVWANQSHPYAKFGTGDRQTLRGGDSSARAALLEFHERYYQADQMSLALIGPQSLDVLQKLAIQKFAAIPSSDPPLPPSSAAYDNLPIPFQPSNAPPEALLMLPVNDVRTLKVRWCVPVTDFNAWLASKPETLWSLLLNNRGKGGLLPLLKRKGLALGLSAYTEETSRSWILLAVDISLEPLGLEKWRDVASLLFAYLRKMRDSGIPKGFVQEIQAISKISFDYAEPSDPQKWAEGISGDLPFFPPEKWITGTQLFADGGEEGAEFMLQQCADPANAMITLVAPSNEEQAKDVEPIYGTKYGKLSLAREVKSWRQDSIPSDFAPPDPNPFIPDDFEIKCSAGGRSCIASKNDGSLVPEVISDMEGLRVHFLQDTTFQRPKALALFLFRSPLFVSSPKDTAIAALFTSVLSDVLQDSTYQAALAGMSAGTEADFDGFSITANGYNSQLPDFLATVSQQVRTAELTPLAFSRQRESARQQLVNFRRKQPIALCSYYRGLAIETMRITNEEMIDAIETTSLSDVLRFQKSLLPEAYLEAFLVGNLEEKEAREMVQTVQKALPSSAPLPVGSIPRRQVKILEPGTRYLQQFVASNAIEENSAISVYLQIGLDEGDNWLLLGFLTVLMQEPFFEELRTRQQLGYIVQLSIDESEGVRGLTLNVQSTVLPPQELEERIDTFLGQYRTTLATLSSTEFNKYRTSLALQVTDVDKRLNGQASRLWTEMVKRRYDYNRPWRVKGRLSKLSKSQLLAFYDRFIVPGASESRRLSTQIFASKVAPANLAVDTLPERFYPAPLEGSLVAVQGNKARA